jgi:hypothetical protein
LTAYESTVKKRDKWCKNATTKREIDLTTMIGPGLNRDFPEKKSEYILCSDYHRKHAVCPKCLKVPPLSTNIGYVKFKFSDGNCYQANHKDENMRKCKCGWEGIEHDLIPSPPKPPELSERQ